MTSEQKITYIEKQISACEQGRQNTINCPYCDEHNIEGNSLCCELFARVVAAVLVRKDDQESADKVERILEKVQSN
jgi:hypothetical protein